jgi:hypothetical protein
LIDLGDEEREQLEGGPTIDGQQPFQKGDDQQKRIGHTNGAICRLWLVPVHRGQLVELCDDVFNGNISQCRRREGAQFERRHGGVGRRTGESELSQPFDGFTTRGYAELAREHRVLPDL